MANTRVRARRGSITGHESSCVYQRIGPRDLWSRGLRGEFLNSSPKAVTYSLADLGQRASSLSLFPHLEKWDDDSISFCCRLQQTVCMRSLVLSTGPRTVSAQLMLSAVQ